ncbi:hypothetical protein FACS1894137_01150 [Spirochaetia bacterium]|nr:hypothetical protein FACS1894137_01150 [Spirochaetia bacterium]
MNCKVCGSDLLFLIYEGVSEVNKDDFKITDNRYGLTLPLFRCRKCGFIQSDSDTLDITKLYTQLEDEEYITSAPQRRKQFQYLIKQTRNYITSSAPKILDIGAGIGLFVKEARAVGWDAEGIEPSVFLSEQARSEGLSVITGTFPHPECPGPYDAIFLTDVIEHLQDPAILVQALPRHLAPDGVVIVVTPNVSSLVAKSMGKKWWHYRIAHLGYYNKTTLSKLMLCYGFEPVKFTSAKWYFSGDYIITRLAHYLPFLRSVVNRGRVTRIMVPVNFFDSYVAIFRMKI